MRCILAPYSPPEIPIQILRAIFVAIKYNVFGLMAQKYSILSAGVRERGDSPRYNMEQR